MLILWLSPVNRKSVCSPPGLHTSSASKNSLLSIEDCLLKEVFIHALNRKGPLMLLMGVDL